jgi:hypothetical protein
MAGSAEFLVDCLIFETPMGHPETSVNKYQSTLSNIPYERKISPTLRRKPAVTYNTTFLDCSSTIFDERVEKHLLPWFRQHSSSQSLDFTVSTLPSLARPRGYGRLGRKSPFIVRTTSNKQIQCVGKTQISLNFTSGHVGPVAQSV